MSLWEKLKTLLKLNTFVNTTIKEAKKMNEGKPGYRTTEFWLNILTNIVTIVGTLKGVIPEQTAAIIIATANGVYGVIRTIVKKAEA